MAPDDESQHPPARRLAKRRRRPRAWVRWIEGARHAQHRAGAGDTEQRAEQFNLHATLRALPTLLDSSSLPNGVVELVIMDFEAQARYLLDIHDGHVTHAEPGKCVPWASIAGSPTAWGSALGPERNTSALELTGDEQLARRVLAALPPSNYT